MVQQYHFEHHLLESKRNRARLRIVLASLAVAAVGLATPAYLMFAGTKTVVSMPESTPLIIAAKPPTAGNASAQLAVAATSQPGSDAPAKPINFQALVMNDNAVVSLSWAGTADATPVKSYRLERSIDQVNWTVLSDTLSELQYRDDKVAFAVRYYYRLTAYSQSGKASASAYADATTGAFTANSSDISGSTLFSDDKVASVQIPAGALADRTVACSIGATSSKPGRDGKKLIAGPYLLICKKRASDQVGTFLKPVVWIVDLKDKIGDYSNPLVTQVKSSSGNNPPIEGAVYDNTAKILTFNQMTTSTIAVYASEKQGLSPSIVAIFIFLVLCVVGVCILVLRKKQEADYNEYLRKKYDNL